MKKLENPICVFIMGRPGAGKDTQAEVVADKYNLQHIVTSDVLRKKFKEGADDPEVKKEKEIFESGVLNTPEWVLKTLMEHVQNLKNKDFNGKNGIIFSGSPRTMFEAENLTPFLENVFGIENMHGVYLEVTDEEGINRILKRAARELDKDPEKLKIRMRQYAERTKPAVDYLNEKGILEYIDGMPEIEKVSENVLSVLSKRIKG